MTILQTFADIRTGKFMMVLCINKGYFMERRDIRMLLRDEELSFSFILFVIKIGSNFFK